MLFLERADFKYDSFFFQISAQKYANKASSDKNFKTFFVSDGNLHFENFKSVGFKYHNSFSKLKPKNS